MTIKNHCLSYLRECLHHRVQQSPDPLGHLEELENSGNPQDSHHSDYSWIDREDLTLDLLQSDANYGEKYNGHVKLIPPGKIIETEDLFPDDGLLLLPVREISLQSKSGDLHSCLDDEDSREEIVEYL